MIPKIIHYCWFGGKPLPELALKCINSWKKYCPDYEIKEWNESNFDVACCDYVREAYKMKKWAFVSDYARFKILYEEGGVYFDTDVELLKSIDDIIEKGPFIGREKVANTHPVNPGLGIATEPRHVFLKEVLEDYNKSRFLDANGEPQFITVVERVTRILKNHGLVDEPIYQVVDGVHVYPSEFFCPLDYNTSELNVTENTRSVHWYDASWLDERMQKRRKVCVKLQKTFRGRTGEIMSKIYTSLSYYWEWISTGDLKKIVSKIKSRMRK